MQDKTTKRIKALFESAKTTRADYVPFWEETAKFTTIKIDTSYFDGNNANRKGSTLDSDVEDVKPAISVFQSADYLMGLMWGTGEEAFSLEPSDDLLDAVSPKEVGDWFEYATSKVLGQMNHIEAGLNNSMTGFFYDQVGIGTSGIGSFVNPEFLNGIEDNIFTFRGYGVDNMAIDEGKAGLVDYIFIVHNWETNKIVSEFAVKNGKVNPKLFAKLPKSIREAYEKEKTGEVFKIIHAITPRENYRPNLKGKRGTKFVGYFFMDGGEESNIFYEEDYKTRPVAVCRQVKVRGEIYGRSSGGMLMSSIRAVNFMVGETMEILEKMGNPALAVTNNALFGDSVLDTSSNALVVLNDNAGGTSGRDPIAPFYDVGDPTGIIQYLIPYLNESIASAFKIDLLLDMNSSKDMTAQEFAGRFQIRGQALSPIVTQQSIEMLKPLATRCVNVMQDLEALGINQLKYEELATTLRENDRSNRIIPDKVVEFMESGKSWYKIRLSDTLRKILFSEKLNTLVQFYNTVLMIAQGNPMILEAVDTYKLLEDISSEMGVDMSYLIGKDAYNDMKAQQQQAMAQSQQVDNMNKGTQSSKNLADAERSKADAQQKLT